MKFCVNTSRIDTCRLSRKNMLIIISDLHLGDGTCGKSISHSAFRLFASRLEELAYSASWRSDGFYRPLKDINILLLGDVLDPLHSTHWLETAQGKPGYVRPWTDQTEPAYAGMLQKITRDILRNNRHAIDILFNITKGHSILIPPAIAGGQPDPTSDEKVEVNVNLHYMVGNHDWFYHIKGPAFDQIRQEIIEAFGLSNENTCFPHEIDEYPPLKELLSSYKVYARHGDIHDSFNYIHKHGRNYASLGDIFAIEVTNRFFVEIEKQMGDELPRKMIENIKELTNVRPLSASWLWVSSQSQAYNLSEEKQDKLKKIWDQLGQEFMALEAVRRRNRKFRIDYYDALFWAFKLSRWASLERINRLTGWLRRLTSGNGMSMAKRALQEDVFIDESASYIVYGHTHHHEIMPLDIIASDDDTECHHNNQLYINSGTWHTYYDLALYSPTSKRFISYQTISYLIFYRDDQNRGQRFETWQGTYS